MDIFQTFILAVTQGISEFLPISSSAHLILLPKITQMPDQGLAFDVVLHLGTLSAVILYYKQDISAIIYDFFTKNPNNSPNSKIGWGIILGTIPVGIFGLLFKNYIETDLRSIQIIAYSTIFFGLLLGFASIIHKNKSALKESISWSDIFIIGTFQALALIPGTSRSGITITAGLFLGLSYKFATKFAFLLSIPVIIVSALYMLLEMYGNLQTVDITLLTIGFLISGISAYIVIFFFTKFIEKIGMMPFVIYRLLLGFGLLLL